MKLKNISLLPEAFALALSAIFYSNNGSAGQAKLLQIIGFKSKELSYTNKGCLRNL